MLDYTSREKKFLSVKLVNGKTLFLGIPKKKLFSKLVSIEKKLKNTAGYESDYDEILSIAAEVLSTNKNGTSFSADEVDEIMDIEDVSLLIKEYVKFAGGIVSNPN